MRYTYKILECPQNYDITTTSESAKKRFAYLWEIPYMQGLYEWSQWSEVLGFIISTVDKTRLKRKSIMDYSGRGR